MKYFSSSNVKKQIDKWDWLLIIGLILAPMTGFRIWKIGPGELLCFIWGLKYISKNTFKLNPTFLFFIVFLTAMSIGSVWCLIKYPEESGINDIFVWIYFAYLAITIYSSLMEKDYNYLNNMLNIFSILAIFWFLFLYIYSLNISKTFFNAPLWFGDVRYTGGGTNPHQIACLLCGLTLLFIYKAFTLKNAFFYFILAAMAVFLLVQTQSSTGYLSVTISFIVFLFLFVVEKCSYNKKATFLILVSIFIILLLLFSDQIYSFALEWISSDANGLGRLEIYSTIYIPLQKSFLFGLGPGAHAQNGIREFHNTYLEIIAASGVVGFLTFLIYSIYLFKSCKKNILMIPIILSMYLYGLAGFAMRRIVYWGIIIFILTISKKKEAH